MPGTPARPQCLRQTFAEGVGQYDAYSSALDGRRIVLGRRFDDTLGEDAGRVLIYEVGSSVPSHDLFPPVPEPGDAWGSSVDAHGDLLLVGAPGEDDLGTDSGTAYLIRISTEQVLHVLHASNGAANHEFGRKVLLTDRHAVVGPYIYDLATGTELFQLQSSSTTILFNIMAAEGDHLVVGDPIASNARGRAYHFDLTTGTLVQEYSAQSSNSGDNFGISVTVRGDRVLIGARHHLWGGATGAAYVFDTLSGTELAEIHASHGGGNDRFGDAVQFVGDSIVVGNPSHTHDVDVQGALFAFDAATFQQVYEILDPMAFIQGGLGNDIHADGSLCLTNSGAELLLFDLAGDCDANGVPDCEELAGDSALDANHNGVPDGCECVARNYCVTSPNSVGPGAVMDHDGSLSLAANDTAFVAEGCPAGQWGLFYMGEGEALAAFGNGWRCVGGPNIVRFVPVTVDASGRASFALDVSGLPDEAAIAAGERRNVQFWYRDSAGGGASFNLSDARALIFCK